MSSERYMWQCLQGVQRGHGDVDLSTVWKFDDGLYLFCFREFKIAVASVWLHDLGLRAAHHRDLPRPERRRRVRALEGRRPHLPARAPSATPTSSPSERSTHARTPKDVIAAHYAAVETGATSTG